MIPPASFDITVWTLVLCAATVLPWFLCMLACRAVAPRLQSEALAGAWAAGGAVALALAVPAIGGGVAAWLIPLLIAGALLGAAEDRGLLGTQAVIPARLLLITAAHFGGFGFAFDPGWQAHLGMLLPLLEWTMTVLLFSGVFASLELLDRLPGMATGVGMVISVVLMSLIIRWGGGGWALIALIAAGACVGTLLLQSQQRRRLGRAVQFQLALLLGAAAAGSRSWGLTLMLLVVPALAILLPMMDRLYAGLTLLAQGEQGSKSLHLRSVLLEAGLSERLIVYFSWIIALQIGVVVKISYEYKSLPFALAGSLSWLLMLGFLAGCLMRFGARLERHREPEKIRILFLSHYFWPEVNAPATRLLEHARAWTRAGHEVTVICPVPSAPHGRLYPGHTNGLWQEEQLDGIRVVRVWTFLAANRRRFRRTLNYLSYMGSTLGALLFIRRHDVMVATTPQFFCGLTGAVASLWRKETFVLEVRDLWPESIEAVGAARPGMPLRTVRRLARWMYGRPARLITVGPGYKEKLIRGHGITPERLRVIPNGVLQELLDYRPEPQRPRLAQLGLADRFVIIYVGTIGMAHGLEVLLRASALPGAESLCFLIIGDGAERARLEAQARHEGLRNVRFTGLRDHRDATALLAEADLALVHLRPCALFESVLPSKLLEAMGLGVPVLLGVRGQSAALVEQHRCGWAFAPGDAEALVEAARKAKGLAPEDRRAAGARGRALAAAQFAREALALQYAQELRAAREEELARREAAVPTGTTPGAVPILANKSEATVPPPLGPEKPRQVP